nr:MAG TPA: hypothetical protein [Caudoviricetes sp.]
MQPNLLFNVTKSTYSPFVLEFQQRPFRDNYYINKENTC